MTQGGAFSSEPSTVADRDSQSFRTLERAIRRVFPNAIVAPYLVVVVTDSRYFQGLSSNIFRFLPLRLTSTDLGRMHGTDERIAVDAYEDAIRLYRQLIVDIAG